MPDKPERKLYRTVMFATCLEIGADPPCPLSQGSFDDQADWKVIEHGRKHTLDTGHQVKISYYFGVKEPSDADRKTPQDEGTPSWEGEDEAQTLADA